MSKKSWSSFPQQQNLVENWNKYLAEQPAGSSDPFKGGAPLTGGPFGAGALRRLSERVGGDYGGVQAVGDERRDVAELDPQTAGRRRAA